MAAFTSKASGNWSASGQTTWTQTGVPGANDTVTINHAVTVDQATQQVGLTAFTTGGTAAITLGSGGSLTIGTGNSLIVSGDIKHTADSIVTMNAGSTLSFLTPSGQQAVWSFSPGAGANYNAYLIANGTSGSHCTVKTDLSLGGIATKSNLTANRNQGLLTCTYTDFLNFGTSSNAGLLTYLDYNNNANCSITHCTFTGCSYVFSNPGGNAWDGNLTFQYNIFSNSVGSTQGGTANACASFNAATNRTSGTRLIDTCSFDLVLGNGGLRQFIISNCYLAAGMVCLSGSWPSASYFSGNLLPGCTVYGSVQNCYFYNTTTSNPHTLAINTGTSVSGCIFDTAAGTGNGDMIFPPSSGTLSVTNNIVVPNSTGNGVTSGKLISDLQTSATAVTAEHNTYCATGGSDANAAVCALGETGGGEYAGCIASCRANLIWTPSAGTNYCFACNDMSADGTSFVGNVVLAGYNGFWNPNTGTCYYNSSTSQAGVTGYKNIRIAANTAYPNATIGTGDVVVTSNPFVDSTRNLATWGGTAAGGGVATAAGAIATIAANPALISQAGTGLLSWVRAGFATTNAALSGSSYPGDTSTTDAAGNAWPGGTPGIGAMGYQSLGNAVLFATACDGGAFDFLTGGMVG